MNKALLLIVMVVLVLFTKFALGDDVNRMRLTMNVAGLAKHEAALSYEMPPSMPASLYHGAAECLPKMKVYLNPDTDKEFLHSEVIPHEVAHLVICAKYGHIGEDPHGREYRKVLKKLLNDLKSH